MSKSPYELRFDLLEMARDMIRERREMQTNMAWSQWSDMTQAGHLLTRKQLEELLPPEITAREVIEKADELYQFVLEK